MTLEAFSPLPKGIQEQRRQEAEVTELGNALRKECVGILSGHGELKKGLLIAVAMKLASPSVRDIKFSELFRYRGVRGKVPINNGMSLDVEIMSLGKSPPGEANKILIHVPTFLMGGTKIALMIGRDGRSDLRTIDFISIGAPSVDKMGKYLQAVNLLGAHLKNTHPPA